jgi:hypothetical protein
MSRTLTHQTKIAVQIVVDDDTDTVADFLTVLTLLIGMLVSFGQFVVSAVLLISDLAEAVSFTFTMWGIAFRALAYGFTGVSL